jgi:hypothetical protein
LRKAGAQYFAPRNNYSHLNLDSLLWRRRFDELYSTAAAFGGNMAVHRHAQWAVA